MQKAQWKNSNQMIYALIGSVVSVIISLGITALVAHFVVSGKIGERTGSLLTTAFIVPAIYVGCEASVRVVKNKLLYIPVTVSVVYLILMLLVGLFLVEGKLSISWVYVGAIGAGCVISCVKCLKKPTINHIKKRRSR